MFFVLVVINVGFLRWISLGHHIATSPNMVVPFDYSVVDIYIFFCEPCSPPWFLNLVVVILRRRQSSLLIAETSSMSGYLVVMISHIANVFLSPLICRNLVVIILRSASVLSFLMAEPRHPGPCWMLRLFSIAKSCCTWLACRRDMLSISQRAVVL